MGAACGPLSGVALAYTAVQTAGAPCGPKLVFTTVFLPIRADVARGVGLGWRLSLDPPRPTVRSD